MTQSQSPILICDDEEGIRESYRLILEDLYPLILTDHPDACLEAFRNQPDISLVLLDIKMPQKSGLDVLKEIKALNPATKVIMVTGYKSVETAGESSQLGADGYIVKPFRAEEILDKVKTSLIN